MKIEKVYTPIKEFEEIDITKALTTNGRLHYPKIARKTRIDDFLARRTHLKLLEERRLLQSVSKNFITSENEWNGGKYKILLYCMFILGKVERTIESVNQS